MSRSIAIVALLLACPAALAQTFSVESGTADLVGGLPPGDDILAPGPGPVVTGGSGMTIEVDGFTYGRTGNPLSLFYFSVDSGATGIPGSGGGVETEFLVGGSGEQNADVFFTNVVSGAGMNTQAHDGNGAGPGGTVAPLGLMEPASGSPDGVDGFDTRSAPGPSIFWSWSPTSSVPPSSSPADILLSPSIAGYTGSTILFAGSVALGLTASDNINALEVYDNGTLGTYDAGDLILFSLDPFSPSLGTFAAGPGDILGASPGAPTGVAIPAGSLGLLASDNVTALSIVPEPGTLLPLSLALGALMTRRRRDRRSTQCGSGHG